MEAFTLAAKLALDTSGFTSSLTQVGGLLESIGLKNTPIFGKLFGFAEKAASTAVDVGKQVIQVGMDFDSAMSQVKALGNLENDDFIKIRKRAMDLGASTKFTATQVAEAFSYMALAGWDTEEMLDGIDGVLNLAAASGEDLGQTSDIITDALTAFGLEAKDAGHFVDVLAAASANSNTTVSMMGQAFKFLAANAGVLNYSIDDVAVTLGLLANNGIKSSQAGTSMRQIINSLVAPSKDAAEAMSELGISLFEEGTDKVKPLRQVLDEMRQIFRESDFDLGGKSLEEVQKDLEEVDAWYDDLTKQIEESGGAVDYLGKKIKQDDLDELYNEKLQGITHFNEDFLGNLKKIGGLRGVSSLISLMKTTDEDYEKLKTAVENSEGAASKMSKTMLDNLEGDITILNSALEGLQIIVSDEFKGKIRDFVTVVTEEIGKLNKAFQQNGLAGMFTNLANWVIDGVGEALETPTDKEVEDFGFAIGKFVGVVAVKLASNIGKYAQGIFDLGTALAGGLFRGLAIGLMGDDTEVQKIVDSLNDELEGVEVKNVKANGLLNYLDELAKKGDANVTKTNEWQTAVAQLEELMPGVKELLESEGTTLEENIEKVRTMTDEFRKQAIQQAMVNTLQKEYELLAQQGVEREKESVKIGVAEGKQQEISSTLKSNIASFSELIKTGIESGNIEDFDGSMLQKVTNLMNGYMMIGDEMLKIEDMNPEQLANALEELQTFIEQPYDENAWDVDPELLSPEERKALVSEYEHSVKEISDANDKIKELNDQMDATKKQIGTTEKAVQKVSSELGVTAEGVGTAGTNVVNALNNLAGDLGGNPGEEDGSHAKGLWNVPYDDYVARLHRGEMVLSSSQAREYRNGSPDFDMSAFEEAVRKAIMTGMSNANVVTYVTDDEVARGANRRNGQLMNSGRFE